MELTVGDTQFQNCPKHFLTCHPKKVAFFHEQKKIKSSFKAALTTEKETDIHRVFRCFDASAIERVSVAGIASN